MNELRLTTSLSRRLSTATMLVALVLATCASTAGAQSPTCRFRLAPRTDKVLLEAIQLLSPTFVLGSDRQCLYVSRNGGLTFRKVRCAPLAPGAEGLINRFYFPSRSLGWVVTSEGGLLRTKDGGKSWEALSFPDHVVRDVHFANTRAGFWVGERVSGSVPDILPAAFTTRDGGQHWSEVPLSTPVEQRARLEGVWMRSPSEVWTVGDLMLTSTNAGTTWQQMRLSADVAADLRNTSIRFNQRGVGWVLRTPADNYLLTCDGGKTWEQRTPPGPGLSMIFHADCMRAYAAAGGHLYRSEDGGRSFHVAIEAEAETQGYTALAYLEGKGLIMALSERVVATCQLGTP
jgi:photosystem II stability/assembly factor-like uncharacterized protein